MKGFIKVDVEECVELGLDAAFLISYLRFREHKAAKDKYGYFSLVFKEFQNVTGWSKHRFLRVRNALVEAKKIDVIEGMNQNTKSRYKLL